MFAQKLRWQLSPNNSWFFTSKHVSTSSILVPELVICNNTDFTSEHSNRKVKLVQYLKHIRLILVVYEGIATKEHSSHPTDFHNNRFKIFYQSEDDDRMRWTADMVVYFGLFQLNDHNIGNSRDISFEQLIMSGTNGRGVDLVLNSLAEEKLQASVSCLALGGRFLEIGKINLMNNSRLGRLYFINLFHFCWYNVIWFCLELQQEKILIVCWLSLKSV